MQTSPAWRDGKFVNLEQTANQTGDFPWRKAIQEMLFPPPGKNPAQPLPTLAFSADSLTEGKIVWFGHSTLLARIGGKTVLTDPVFYRASPFLFLGGKPFAFTETPRIADLPDIDIVLISHDHYDHLDYRAVRGLDGKTALFYVPLGVKAHLQRWGIADEKIVETDWYESAQNGEITLHYVPSRHFSGRKLETRNHTLWGGWIVQGAGISLYFGADGGYGSHFAEIAARFAPFDLVLLENGAYNEAWAQIHEMPEETFQAAQDVRAQRLMPIHWAKFDLSHHGWTEPVERLLKAAENSPMQILTPQIGQVFDIRRDTPQEFWWRGLK